MLSEETKTLLLIVGMKGNGCREIVTEALEVIRGVSEVHVNLYRGHAMVRHEQSCEPEMFITAVQGAGYDAILAPAAMIKPPSRTDASACDEPSNDD